MFINSEICPPKMCAAKKNTNAKRNKRRIQTNTTYCSMANMHKHN